MLFAFLFLAQVGAGAVMGCGWAGAVMGAALWRAGAVLGAALWWARRRGGRGVGAGVGAGVALSIWLGAWARLGRAAL